MAIFYSNSKQAYKCFKCLLEEQDLIYIDKQFKKDMEQFEKVKEKAARVIKTDQGKMNMMKNWRKEIRHMLVRVRTEFVKWIDNFTQQFFSSLRDIEKSKELSEFAGIDIKLNG